MGQALYRKYRSKSLAQIVGQEHITKTLDQALKANRISHAYLFTGPRGVGKTSIARILAHDINGLKYTDDSSHVDIIEIDAASNRRIDEIRDIRDKVYIAPSMAKYKIYIIDEVHMLTNEAFNALLKILEEPPSHVIFILATTDAHKLPDTIVSRTQRFQFRPIETEKVINHLRDIAQKETIGIDDDALRLIAQHGQGSFRDSISLLDQSANYSQPVTAETIHTLLGTPPDERLDRLIAQLFNDTSKHIMSSVCSLFDSGYPAPIIASRLSSKLRDQLINETSYLPKEKLLNLLNDLIDVPASADPEHFLEICLIRAMPDTDDKIINQSDKVVKAVEVRTKTVAPDQKPKESSRLTRDVKPKKTQQFDKVQPDLKESGQSTTELKQPANETLLNEANWNDVLVLLKAKYNTLYGIVRMAKIDTSEPGLVKLHFAFVFHQKRINDAKNRDIILAAIKKVTNKTYRLECIIDKSLLSSKTPKTIVEETADLSAISNIFGGGEILPQ